MSKAAVRDLSLWPWHFFSSSKYWHFFPCRISSHLSWLLLNFSTVILEHKSMLVCFLLSYLCWKQPFLFKWGLLSFHPLKSPVFSSSQSFVRPVHLSFFQSAPDILIQPGLQHHNHCSSLILFMHTVFAIHLWPAINFMCPCVWTTFNWLKGIAGSKAKGMGAT